MNQTIVEYYDAFFHPFDKFTEKEREGLRQKLLVDAKMEEDYDKYSTKMEDIDELINTEEPQSKVEENRMLMLPTEAHRQKLLRQYRSLNALAHDQGLPRQKGNVPCVLWRSSRRNSMRTPS